MEIGGFVRNYRQGTALVALGGLLVLQACGGGLACVRSWAALYSVQDHSDVERLMRFDLAVVDPDHFPSIARLKANGVITLGYVSVGEAESYRDYWSDIKGAGWIVRENPNWKGNYVVDFRADRWRRLLLDRVIPDLLAKGFDGVLLDTVDVGPELEAEDPEAFAGAKESMIELIATIKGTFPDAYVVPNNGLAMLPELACTIDGLMVEDLTHWYNFKTMAYEPVPAEQTQWKLNAIQQAREACRFPVFVADYARPDDAAAIERSRRVCEENGFVPYVTTIGLDRVYARFGRDADE